MTFKSLSSKNVPNRVRPELNSLVLEISCKPWSEKDFFSFRMHPFALRTSSYSQLRWWRGKYVEQISKNSNLKIVSIKIATVFISVPLFVCFFQVNLLWTFGLFALQDSTQILIDNASSSFNFFKQGRLVNKISNSCYKSKPDWPRFWTWLTVFIHYFRIFLISRNTLPKRPSLILSHDANQMLR